MMDRRTLISAIAVATVCARSGAFAQQQRSWRVGFVALPERPEPLEGSRFGGFALGMRELGYIEGRNLTIEWRVAGGRGGGGRPGGGGGGGGAGKGGRHRGRRDAGNQRCAESYRHDTDRHGGVQ